MIRVGKKTHFIPNKNIIHPIRYLAFDAKIFFNENYWQSYIIISLGRKFKLNTLKFNCINTQKQFVSFLYNKNVR